MRVAVIGGGIVGLSCAYALAERGATVTLLERDRLGGESTQRAVGGIRTQFSTPVNVDLSLHSLRVWESFETEFGVDIGHRRTGYLFLARDEETARQFRADAAMQNDRGADTRVLDPEAVTDHCPGVAVERFAAATYSPLDGFADPNLAAQGYARAVKDRGVDVRTGTPVTDVRVDDGRVVGVETSDGTVPTDAVVNAAGVWAPDVAALAGVDLPVEPKRRQVAVVHPSEKVPESLPLTINLDTGSYFRPERDGAALVGGHFADDDPTADPDDYDVDVDIEWAATAVERAAEWTTYFGPDTRIARGWAGLYAVTPDHHPVVEESLPGFYTAAGFSGHGFMHAPATGDVVAALVAGDDPPVDVSGLDRGRFARGDARTERNVA